MSTKTVEVRYVGPGSDTDKRVLNVTESEAKRLQANGLWKATKSTKKRSVNDG